MMGVDGKVYVDAGAVQYCDKCDRDFPVYVCVDDGGVEEAPQLYLQGLHVHVGDGAASLEVCLYVNRPEELIPVLELLARRAANKCEVC